MNRRQFLRTAFCSSAALGLACENRALAEGEARLPQGAAGLDLLVLADFGSAQPPQAAVASAMRTYVDAQQLKPAALMMLGDNFYGRVRSGVNSSRWRKGISEMYPKSHFPGPMWALLGNHDYHDTPGGDAMQLERARRTGTRWTMPAKWYRLDVAPHPTELGRAETVPAGQAKDRALATLLFLDTNWPSISGGTVKKDGVDVPRACLDKEEETAQLAWLAAQLESPRAPWTFVLGHHPVFSNGRHGDTKSLAKRLDPLLRQHKVPLYLCGHDHDLQHLEIVDHTTSFVLCGGGGARVRPAKREDRGPYFAEVHGFSHLQIAKDRLTFRHLDANAKQIHSFTRTLDGTVSVGAA